jgi:hypothetical protein
MDKEEKGEGEMAIEQDLLHFRKARKARPGPE